MSSKPASKPKRPPDFQDELDVYEAVYRIGKKQGKNLLKPEQLKMLTESGRISQEEVKDQGDDRAASSRSQQPKRRDDLTEEGIHKRYRIAREVTYQLLDAVEADVEKATDAGVKSELSEKDETRNRHDLFRLVYGTSPQIFARDLFHELLEY